MTLPEQPVTLSVQQIATLNRELGEMRHDINNKLSLILAAAELIRAKPEQTELMVDTLLEQPAKISQSLQIFSSAFENSCGIRRDKTARPGL